MTERKEGNADVVDGDRMTPERVDEAAALLERLRLAGETVERIPDAFRPRSLADAYAIQDRLAERLGWPVGGWFCACTNTVIQRLLGLEAPYYARLFEKLLFPAPAVLNAADYPPIVLECEFAFRIARDLPSRAEPYARAEVEDAIASVHPAIEVVAGHLQDWPAQEVWSVIADNGTDGALVYGEGVSDWRELDLLDSPVTLEVNGREERRGSGRNVLGDPLDALVWLVNARARAGAGEGLKAGHLHNTGTATDILWLSPGDRALARFEGLGEVALTLRG